VPRTSGRSDTAELGQLRSWRSAEPPRGRMSMTCRSPRRSHRSRTLRRFLGRGAPPAQSKRSSALLGAGRRTGGGGAGRVGRGGEARCGPRRGAGERQRRPLWRSAGRHAAPTRGPSARARRGRRRASHFGATTPMDPTARSSQMPCIRPTPTALASGPDPYTFLGSPGILLQLCAGGRPVSGRSTASFCAARGPSGR